MKCMRKEILDGKEIKLYSLPVKYFLNSTIKYPSRCAWFLYDKQISPEFLSKYSATSFFNFPPVK